MSVNFSAPGKTFLAGEYLALEGGMALLAMTGPRFELQMTDGSGAIEGISVDSPAGKFIAREKDHFKKLDLKFRDPYDGAGGWGASTAQYLTAFAAREWSAGAEYIDGFDLKVLFENYKRDAWNGEGRAPSGADLVGQLKGRFTFFERNAGMTSQGAWPFYELEPYLIRTGVKVPTHEHLKTLTGQDFFQLAPIMGKIRDAWKSSDSVGFAEGISAYGKELARQKLTTESTLHILHDLAWLSFVKAAKGCGALGADTVFILVDKTMQRSFELWAEEKNYSPIRLLENISPGLTA